MQDSIFTKIIKGEIPCHKVYEDDKTFAFLDIHPIQPGQALIVPKSQVEFVWDLSIEGLDVAHAHIKVFPFSTDAEFRHHPDMNAEPDHTALADIAQKLQHALYQS